MEYQTTMKIEELRVRHQAQLMKVEQSKAELRYYEAKATETRDEINALREGRDRHFERDFDHDFVSEFY